MKKLFYLTSLGIILIFIIVCVSNNNFLFASVNNKNETTIVDVNNWEHPTKKVFEENGFILKKIELIKNKTYPIFYVENTGTQTIYNNVFLHEVAKKNSFWDFKIVENEKFVEIYCNKKQKIIINVVSDKGIVNKLNDNQNKKCISIDKAAEIAVRFCRKPNVGVQAYHDENNDVVIKGEKYYYFDMIYGLLMGDKPAVDDNTISSLFINSVNGSIFEVIERKEKGKDMFLPGKVLNR